MIYHLSDIKKYLKCDSLYYLQKDEVSSFNPYLRLDENLDDLLIRYFKIGNYFLGMRNDSGERFFLEEYNYEYFLHARFQDGKLRINIPYMLRKPEGYEICFVVYGTQIKELDSLTYACAYEILKNKGLKVKDIFVVYFNPDYVFNGQYDVDKLFVCSKYFKGEPIIRIVKRNYVNYLGIIEQMESASVGIPIRKRYCRSMGLCPYYYQCFKEDDSDHSILSLVACANKNKMYKQGIRELKDVDPCQIEGTKMQYAQIMADKKGGLFLDKFSLKNFLDSIADRPLSFIDFEWDTYLLPKYPNMKPLDVICFEYVLYVLDEKGNIEHKTFVATGDCREEFILSLLANVPKDGPILAYNIIGGEGLRLKELATIYPQYKEDLMAIVGRLVDLATPLMEGMVYDIRLRGDYSLKKLVSITSKYSYSNLDIHNGLDAVYSWRNIDKHIAQNSQEVIKHLEEYCSLDAYGLYLVYQWLVQLIV